MTWLDSTLIYFLSLIKNKNIAGENLMKGFVRLRSMAGPRDRYPWNWLVYLKLGDHLIMNTEQAFKMVDTFFKFWDSTIVF